MIDRAIRPVIGAVACVIFFSACAHFEPRPISAARTVEGLESRTLGAPGLRSYIESNLHREIDVWPPKAWDFQMLTLAAFYFHPSLDVARAQWGVARAGVNSAGGRPNPVLSVTPGYTVNPASGVSPWFPAVNLDIPIETANKRGYRVAHAEQVSESARLNLTTVAWQVRQGVQTGLLDETAARQRAALLQKQIGTQQQIVTLLEQRVAAGAMARADLTVPRLALVRAETDLADALRQVIEAHARVAESLGIPARAIEGIAFEPGLTADTGAVRGLTTVEARQQALLGRSDIRAALVDYAASQSALQLEIARQYPDVHLSPGYQFDQGEHKWSIGVAVDLPVFNQNQGPIAEAVARREEVAARFLALQSAVMAAIDRSLALRTAALERLDRQEKLSGLAREQLAAAESLLAAGAADRLDLAGARLESMANDLAVLDARIKAAQAVAQLEDAIQRPLESWPELERGRATAAQQEHK